jgi:4-hydroxyphenylpyruvate dioxygenase
MQRTAGAGAQHIAFACPDALAAAARLPAGMRLPIPDNYYEDLSARFGLDDALLERLRAHAVLYDRIGEGELLHVFTQAINGVFFELLERRSYDRYGEANAPVRLTAQAALDRSLSEQLTSILG